MASNSFGEIFRITTFGESHGPALGVVIDGAPAGLALAVEDFLPELARRRPGQSAVTTARVESDRPEILSGVFEGKTTGMPITVIVRNEGQRSSDYEELRATYRAGHADRTYAEKYGHRDHRGGGRASGRETVARVIAGVVARKVLPENLLITAFAQRIGPHEGRVFDPSAIEKNTVRAADPEVARAMESYILALKEAHDSTGGIIEVRVTGMPKSLGDPVFKKLKARLADAALSIGAVQGFALGAGFDVATMRGTEYLADARHFGGVAGGISTGEDLVFRIAVKPTSSVGEIAKRGRHDPCVVPRVVPVIEAMTAITLADAFLLARASRG